MNNNEWQEEINQYGGVRRFRWIGKGCKEYEPTILIDGIEVPQSQLEEFNRRRREAVRVEQPRQETAPKTCPFSGGGHNCTRDKCALYSGDGCKLARIATGTTTNTEGMACPFSPYRCRRNCALFKNDGCILTAM